MEIYVIQTISHGLLIQNITIATQFNSGYDSSNGTITSLKQSTISGSDFGLQLTLYVNILDKFSIHNWFKEIGAVIRIGNSSYKTYYSNGDGILLSPGLKTNIVVEREFK
jgi:hypothetical protein